MLTEERHTRILEFLEERRSATVIELTELLEASESTIRRDITSLSKKGRLIKVFGGAVALDKISSSQEPTVAQKEEVNLEEKRIIASYAASLIEPEDFVYLDAGTTTASMLDYINEASATYVTNAVSHAKQLAAKGFRVLLVGGELKASTEAIVGSQAVVSLKQYHFTKGFFGANGVSASAGFTTPDVNEAVVKESAVGQSHKAYILSDHSKFGNISSCTFATMEQAMIITDCKPSGEYAEWKNILIAE